MCLLTYSPFWMSLKITILYLQQSECVCVCVCVCVSMRAVYLFSIIKPFISAYVCVSVFVCLLFIKHF